MKCFYLGCDASKGFCDFVMLNQDKKIVIKSFQYYDNANGHNKLRGILEDFYSKHPDCLIIAGVESTGGYENNWFETLCELQETVNIQVARINPIGTHHSSKASLDRVVTDKKSAKTIAEYLINFSDKLSFKKRDKYTALKRQWKYIKLLIKQKTQVFNQLEKSLYTANPELLQYVKYGYKQWLLNVIMKYPTAKDLARARISTLTAMPYISKERAAALVEGAKNSVASAKDDTMGIIIKSMVGNILHFEEQIEEQCKYIADNCNLEEIDILKSFIGISDYSAIGLLIYIGDVNNFPDVKHLASFFGMHPVWKQSGDGTSGMYMSKKGNKEIRALLYNVSLSAIVHNPRIKEIYRRHVSKGKNKTAAMVACMHKILRIVYGMLKHKEKYNMEKDRANAAKFVIKTAEVIKNHPPVEYDAPLSKRQYKKRKQQETSQDEITSSNTGSFPHCFEIVI